MKSRRCCSCCRRRRRRRRRRHRQVGGGTRRVAVAPHVLKEFMATQTGSSSCVTGWNGADGRALG